jgi:hypothetical protein
LRGQLERTRDSKRIAEIEQELALPPFPEEYAYLWKAYHRIRARKGGGPAGVLPIEWPDIDAFVRNSKQRFDPMDIEIIEALDDVFLRVR